MEVKEPKEYFETALAQVSALQSAGDGVIVTDTQGRIEFVNATAECLTGVPIEAAQGRPLHEVLRLEEKYGGTVLDNLVELAMISESTVDLGRDLVLVPHRGPTRQVDGEISVRTNSGSATGAVVTFRDVSARNWDELQRREEQKTHAVGQFAGYIAHELNNSLAVVLGHAELLTRDSSAEPFRVHAAAIQKGANGIAALSRQLHALSRKEVLHPIAINLNHLLERSRLKLKSLVPSKIDLTFSLASGLGAILIDPVQMEQALVELVRHSSDRMPDGGNISIATGNVTIDDKHRARYLRRYVQLTIRDAGPALDGLAAEDLFQPSWNKELGRPSGLGLFTVRNMVSATHGHLSVESDSANGAQFVLLFPQVEVETRVTSAFQVHATVLLVEADDAIRILLNNSLEQRGYSVIEARDGEEALLQADLSEEPVDLLITSVAMPHMDGLNLARRLLVTSPDTKVLLISGDREEGIPDGAHHMSRPFSQRELLARVDLILNSSKTAAG
jgi:two-component system cell cycle sensor histidine kinase/response regulator CckA